MQTKITMARIAFQGEPGAFSEHAARHYFGAAVAMQPWPYFADLFEAVQKELAEAAIVPIENSLTGSILQNYDLLLRYAVVITGEIILRIGQHLMALPGVHEGDLRRVFSHPQALDQCRNFLSARPQLERVPAVDTAGSAKMIAARQLRDAAAIAGERAATVYGLEILQRHIEDDPQNFTRFLMIEKTAAAARPQERQKTSVVFSTRDKPGSLYRALGVLASRGINLLKIESRPQAGLPWQYRFYLDLEGDAESDACQVALRELAEMASDVRVLGSYAKGRVIGEAPSSTSESSRCNISD